MTRSLTLNLLGRQCQTWRAKCPNRTYEGGVVREAIIWRITKEGLGVSYNVGPLKCRSLNHAESARL